MPNVPTEAAERKALPIARGCLDYFPDALLAVAELSRVCNEQHNPGQPLHWAKEKSTDEADALMRHLIDRGKRDTDGIRHSAKVAWRALALLQREIEAENQAASDAKLFERVDRIMGRNCPSTVGGASEDIPGTARSIAPAILPTDRLDHIERCGMCAERGFNACGSFQ